MWQVTFLLLQRIMAALESNPASLGGSTPLETVYVGLYTAPTPAPSAGMLIGDITECNYTGYARQLVVWYPTYQTSGGPQVLEGHSLRFQPTDAVTPNQGTGVFIGDAVTAGALLMAMAFATPANLSNATRGITVDPWFQLPYTVGTYGGPEITT